MSSPYHRLRELLQSESYPHCYTHKFIGQNTPAFAASVAALEGSFPKVRRVAARESGRGGDAGRYLAFTYELDAESVEEIIALLDATTELADLKMIL